MLTLPEGACMTLAKTYSTEAAASQLGISKSTLLRWIRDERVKDVRRDRNNWRVFSDQDIKRIKATM
jgi:excisionase family DNA binding protein